LKRTVNSELSELDIGTYQRHLKLNEVMKISLPTRSYIIAALRHQSVSRVNNLSYPIQQRNIGPFVHSHISYQTRTLASKTNMSPISSNNGGEHDIIQTMTTRAKFEYPLIDVDCNLLHSDLAGLLSSSEATTDEGTTERPLPPYIEKSKSRYLSILHHPSTSLSNIKGVFSPSSTLDESEKLHNVLIESTEESRNYIDIKMSVGIHPYHTNESELGKFTIENEATVIDRLKELLEKDEKNKYGYIKCIGEAGLDYSDGFPHKDDQRPWFKLQVELAKEYKLPLFVHERLAFEDTLEIIDEVFGQQEHAHTSSSQSSGNIVPIIIHCFTGTKVELQEYVKRGYYISISGYILKSGENVEEVISCLKEGLIPLDKLMVETDAPYMGFNTCRETYYDIESDINTEFQSLNSKKRKRLIKGIYPNVPSSLPKVFEKVVEYINDGRNERGEVCLSVEDAASKFYQNSKAFFGF